MEEENSTGNYNKMYLGAIFSSHYWLRVNDLFMDKRKRQAS